MGATRALAVPRRAPESRYWLLVGLLALWIVVTKGDGGMLDLKVYRRGAEWVAHGEALYDQRPGLLPFTYPPFAAIFVMPFAAIPWLAAVKLWSGISFVSLAAVLRQSAPRAVATRPLLMVVALVGCAYLEPVRSTTWFGQINLVLAAMIMLDLLGKDRFGRGFLVGVAAGLKLTPLVFLGFLLVTRQWAALRNACAGFAVTVAAAFLVVPGESWRYWADILHSAARVGGTNYPSNQSFMGFLFRVELHGDAPWVMPVWFAAAAVVGVWCLALARHLWNSGEALGAVSVCALASLLASPVSWSHHWIWVIPIGITLIDTARRRARRPGRPIAAVAIGLAWFGWFRAGPIWWVPVRDDSSHYWTFGQALLGDSYIIAALLALTYLSWATRVESTVSPVPATERRTERQLGGRRGGARAAA